MEKKSHSIQVQKPSIDKNKLISSVPEPTLLQPILAHSFVTCLGQNDGPVCYSTPWSTSHKHVPGTHRSPPGPGSFPGSCCWFLPHSLCWSPEEGAAGNGSPGVGSDHLTSLRRKGHKLIPHTMYHRSTLLETRIHIKWGTTLDGSQWWNPFWKGGIKTLAQPFPPLRKRVTLWKILHVTFAYIQLQHLPRQSHYHISWLWCMVVCIVNNYFLVSEYFRLIPWKKKMAFHFSLNIKNLTQVNDNKT